MDDFLVLLKGIYTHGQGINGRIDSSRAKAQQNLGENIDVLITLSHRFHVSFLVNKCEEFLITCNCKSADEKMLLADTYQLPRLHDHCLKKLASSSDIRTLRRSMGDSFHELSNSSKNALLEKCLNGSD